jgi:hypothetical protein
MNSKLETQIMKGFWFVFYRGIVLHREVYGLRPLEYYDQKLKELEDMYVD